MKRVSLTLLLLLSTTGLHCSRRCPDGTLGRGPRGQCDTELRIEPSARLTIHNETGEEVRASYIFNFACDASEAAAAFLDVLALHEEASSPALTVPTGGELELPFAQPCAIVTLQSGERRFNVRVDSTPDNEAPAVRLRREETGELQIDAGGLAFVELGDEKMPECAPEPPPNRFPAREGPWRIVEESTADDGCLELSLALAEGGGSDLETLRFCGPRTAWPFRASDTLRIPRSHPTTVLSPSGRFLEVGDTGAERASPIVRPEYCWRAVYGDARVFQQADLQLHGERNPLPESGVMMTPRLVDGQWSRVTVSHISTEVLVGSFLEVSGDVRSRFYYTFTPSDEQEGLASRLDYLGTDTCVAECEAARADEAAGAARCASDCACVDSCSETRSREACVTSCTEAAE